MSAANHVTLFGRITRDPDSRVTPTGMAVCAFSVAVNESRKDKDGKPVEDVTFVDVESFGKQAEAIGRFMTKGRAILLEGRLKLHTWEKDGERRSKLGVVLEGFNFVDSKPKEDA